MCECGTPWTFLLLFFFFYFTDRSKAVVPLISLTFTCFMVYSAKRFVFSLALCYCVLVFSSPLSFVITSLGEERDSIGAFRFFVRFALVW